MRILQISNGYPHRAYGGVELHTHRLVGALRERGHELSVFTRRSDLGEPDGSAVDERVDGVPVRTVVNDFKSHGFRAHYLQAEVAQRFREFVGEVRPEVVHVQHLIGLSADLPEIARSLGARVVATVHEYWYVCARVMFQHRDGSACPGPARRSCIDCVLGEAAPRPGLGERILSRLPRVLRSPAAGPGPNRHRFETLRRAIACFERITTPARFVIEEFGRQGMPLPPERTRAIALGIDGRGFSSPPAEIRGGPPSLERPLRVGFVGHSLPHKAPHVLLDALRLLPDRPIRVELWGRRWPDHPYDVEFSLRLGAEPRAVHRGRFADGELPRVLESFDVLAVPSICPESFGIATREALLAGRPVISSDRGALPESVRHGEDGWVVPGGDPRALAAALQRLLDEPGLLATLARGARETSSRTKTMERYASELEEFLYLRSGRPARSPSRGTDCT